MKFLTCGLIKDFGHEYYISFLKGKKHAFVQISVSWSEYPGWPYLQFSSGQGRVFSLLFWCYKFGIDIDIFAYNWPIKYN
jgi:hypothetical protein